MLVILDLSAVFDTIDHAILLHRLEHHYGLGGEVKDWVVSYLGGRRQRVCIGDDKSPEKDLFYSVQQGSILGVEYYCLYSKPVTAIIRYHRVIYHIYADDSQLNITITPGDDISRLTANIERCVRDVNCWMSENMLKLNKSKTEVIFFSAKKQHDPFADIYLTFGDSVIHPIREVWNLGVP